MHLSVWKTESVTALPGLRGTGYGGAGHNRGNALMHRVLLRLGTDGKSNGIPL